MVADSDPDVRAYRRVELHAGGRRQADRTSGRARPEVAGGLCLYQEVIVIVGLEAIRCIRSFACDFCFIVFQLVFSGANVKVENKVILDGAFGDQYGRTRQ